MSCLAQARALAATRRFHPASSTVAMYPALMNKRGTSGGSSQSKCLLLFLSRFPVVKMRAHFRQDMEFVAKGPSFDWVKWDDSPDVSMPQFSQ